MFPFDLPGPTQLYLGLFILTLAAHALAVGYVLAGSTYVAAVRVRRALGGQATADPMESLLVDWLPFALGAAITAGVAPLLFLQILYKHSFYTASLLLVERWLALVPVLMLGFYALYLAKSKRLATAHPSARAVVSVVALVCFLFVAATWSETHRLALAPEDWIASYVGDPKLDRGGGPIRVLFWLAAAFPVLAVGLSYSRALASKQPRRLAGMAIAGLILAAGLGAAVHAGLGDASREAVALSAAAPYWIGIAIGVLLQLGVWTAVLATGRLRRVALHAACFGLALCAITGGVLRELTRWATFDTAELIAAHEASSRVGGLPWFLLFAAINGALIVWCVRITRKTAS